MPVMSRPQSGAWGPSAKRVVHCRAQRQGAGIFQIRDRPVHDVSKSDPGFWIGEPERFTCSRGAERSRIAERELRRRF